MKVRWMLLSLLLLSFMADVSFAEARAKGTTSLNGKTISYEFVGENSASVSSSASNNTATIKANVDGTTHQIDISLQKLIWNKQTFKLNGYNRIEIFIGNGASSIKVDGKEILP
jgi:hypothetical protein